MGQTDLTKKQLKYLLEIREEKCVSPTIISTLYFALDNITAGIEYLELASKENDPIIHMINVIPLWEEFKKIPQVVQFIDSWQSRLS